MNDTVGLEVLGLSRTQEAVYRSLLAGSTEGIEELSSRLTISTGDVGACLEHLLDMGLLQPSRERSGTLRAVSPDIGFEIILRRHEAELLHRQKQIALGKEIVARTVAAYTREHEPVDGGPGERLIGLDTVQQRLESLTRQLRDECLAIEPGGAQSQASLDAARPLDESALDRGIRFLTVYQDTARNDPATHAHARWINERGGQVRTIAVTPPRLIIFDRRTAIVPIDPSHTRKGALCTTAPGIVSALVALFEQTWENALPLDTDPRADRDGTGLTTAERGLLRLLASGVTDEVAGKRLGVSVRTVRRQVAALMERLEATSRFEAGLKAAQRGWF
ncbi:LuxR C-terminal-related transcriptional regulator [Streptomyces sp. NPDC002785]|uniref:helix-turn-helix transcriptional regulator n=1 Tax=Streptomyces sp. NPDC002785 TaxID=3154543 RepID=UPI00332D68E6